MAGTAGTTACAVVAMGMLSVTMTFCIVVWTFTTCPLARNVPSLANLRLSRIEELGSNWTMSASSRTERLSVFVKRRLRVFPTHVESFQTIPTLSDPWFY